MEWNVLSPWELLPGRFFFGEKHPVERIGKYESGAEGFHDS